VRVSVHRYRAIAGHERAVTQVGRQEDLDWLRGLMLVLMTTTHLPTWFSAHAGQPFGFVSAAEGFVFLSAFLVGCVYSHKARVHGYAAMRRALWGRALKVYAAHAAVLLFLLCVLVPIAVSRDAQAITGLASYYLERPHLALASGLVLAYNPPLLDILPMYVLFLVASPLVLGFAMRRGWGALLAVSAVVWLFAQYDGGRRIYEAIAALVDWPVPYGATGAFSFMAWQLLWLVGLRVGTAYGGAEPSPVTAHRAWWGPGMLAATSIAATFFVWRHVVGQAPFGSDALLNPLFDKWHLGPLRLLNFAVLALIVVKARPMVVAWARDSSIAVLGRASLFVFSAHLLICLAVLTVLGDAVRPHLSVSESLLLLGTLGVLYGVARASLAAEGAVRAGGRALAARLSTRGAR
jgi:hypothetical protein